MSQLTPAEQRAVQIFQERVHAYCVDQSVEFRLFGSKARGEAHAESDVDVLVLVPEASGSIRGAIYEIAGDVLVQTDIEISPLVMSHDHFRDMLRRERLLAREIQRDGVSL